MWDGYTVGAITLAFLIFLHPARQNTAFGPLLFLPPQMLFPQTSSRLCLVSFKLLPNLTFSRRLTLTSDNMTYPWPDFGQAFWILLLTKPQPWPHAVCCLPSPALARILPNEFNKSPPILGIWPPLISDHMPHPPTFICKSLFCL